MELLSDERLGDAVVGPVRLLPAVYWGQLAVFEDFRS